MRVLPSVLLTAALVWAGASAAPGLPLSSLPPSSSVPASPWPELLPEPARPLPAPPLVPLSPAPTPTTAAPAVYRPADPLYPRQWNLQAIRAPGAWAQLAATGRGARVTVAVLDTGFVNSPELAGRVVNGYDFVSDPARAGDGDGRDADASGVGPFAYHAEIIGNLIGAAHDGRGMAGINPQARVVQIRVGGTDGMIAPQDLADALRWAAGLSVPGVPVNPNPAKVLNLSLYADFIPLTGCDARIQAAVDAVTARGALVVAGAANDGTDASGYTPAGCRNVLTVTSVTEAGQRPGYANWGASVALAAPGGEPGHGIPASSVSGPGGERAPDGTSFAAPHAAGVASLLFGLKPTLTPAQVRDLLTRTVTPFPAGRCDPDPRKSCGRGLLNAEAAVRAVLGGKP
ncbi:serine protease [Deinococcus metallilatus]|uniref:Serine protease n=1 Tax=Deinococcus metallilatus TaxID=1211322 RepID=A0AAJ5JYF6_9DEIO|nr:S8 family serine peptidase [Deinococcus metallilatus]MBB5295404.1 serine protease [Deinococcus metallilatus]QBY08067.1 serine protease [Deinococcus metallilatus]RXJ12960.1 serine protease [Deinococcus metallilatus]TLK27118.1 serine protease [Deinococcus metallilatus]